MKFGSRCSYLDAELFDEGGSRCVFVRRKLFDYQEGGDTIDLVSCVVKNVRHSIDLESLVNKSAKLGVSTVKVEPDVKVTKTVNVETT